MRRAIMASATGPMSEIDIAVIWVTQAFRMTRMFRRHFNFPLIGGKRKSEVHIHRQFTSGTRPL